MSEVAPSTDDHMSRLEAQLAAQQRRLDALEHELGRNRATPPGPPIETGPPTAADRRLGRRQLLRRGMAGAAVAGVAAVGAGAGPAAPAGAATGDPLLVGQGNVTGGETILTTTGGGDPRALLMVRDTYNDPPAGMPKSSVMGVANGTKSWTGVCGAATAVGGTGVTAYSQNGHGIYAYGGQADIYLAHDRSDPRNEAGLHLAGELVKDGFGNIWACVSGGWPGTWRKMATADGPGSLHLLPSPVRSYDSRPGKNPSGVGPKVPLVGGELRAVNLGTAVPAVLGANGVLCNLTVTNTSEAGWLAVYADGANWGGTSNVNWSQSGATVANLAVSAVSSERVILRCASGSSTDVVIDIIGYYA